MHRTMTGLAILLSALIAPLFIGVKNLHAVPSFARQTGFACTMCHTVWPQLTPFGRIFKQDGFVFGKESASKQWSPPVAAMIQASYTALDKNSGILKNGVAPFDDAADSAVDKFNLPQQASLFYGGRIIGHLGALAQLTYDGTANDIALDNTDIRYAWSTTAGGKPLVVGATVNNAPTVEDLWNATPVWGFPFASSAVAPSPSAATLIDGTLGQQVGGIGAYASWANLIYAAASVYRTTNNGIARPLGAGTSPDMITDGAVPYWRVALSHQWNQHTFEIGSYGLHADVYPGGADSGPTDAFTDYAFDGQYQFIAPPHIFNLHAAWSHENQDWNASFPAGTTSNHSDELKTLKVNAGYYYRASYGTIGGDLGYFATDGDTDPLLYSAAPVVGSRTGSPESKGFILQATYLWREKYKFALQYTIYEKFNGASDNYDGFGRDAGDNNTIYLFAWLLF